MDFGEVVTTSSRAFCDDYEEWEANRIPAEELSLDFSVSSAADREALENIETFLVLEGTSVASFYQDAVLKGVQLVGQVAGRRIGLYVLPQQRIAVLLTEERDLMKFGQVTELLIPYIKLAKRVLTINVEPSVSYKVDRKASDQDGACFIRGINTKKSDPNVMELLTPNLLTGIAAGVATWREFSKLPWSSYVAYVNEPEMNALTTTPILQLIRDLGVPCAARYNAKASDDSNLYT